MNIVSMAMQYLTPMLVDRIAGALGINSTIAKTAIAAILPTILSGILGKASAPGGGQALSDLLGKQDPSILGNLGGLIGGPGQSQFAEQGAGVLGSLLGNGPMGALAGAAAKFTGMGDGPTKGLLGMLAPVVLGSLASQQKSSGLDASGLVSMLMGQKDNIAAAIPADFAKMLSGSGMLDSIGPNLAKASAMAMAGTAATKAQDTIASTARTVEAAMPKAPAFNFIPWVVAALAAFAAYWFLFAGSTPKLVQLPAVPSIIAPGNVNLGSQIGGTMANLQRALGGVRDVATATAALGDLRQAQSDVQRIGGLAAQLPPEAKRSLAGYMTSALPAILPLITKFQGDSAIGPVLKPILDSILSGLNGMAKS